MIDRSTSIPSRESEVLRLLGEGRSTKEIAAELGVSQATVCDCVADLLSSLGMHSRLRAVIAGQKAASTQSRPSGSKLRAIVQLEVELPDDEQEADQRADAVYEAIDDAVADLVTRAGLGIVRGSLEELDWREEPDPLAASAL